MFIAVVSPNLPLKTLLEGPFKLLNIDSMFLETLPKDKVNYDLVITDCAQSVSAIKNQVIFFISTDERSPNSEDAKIFKAPVRVGHLCDEVLYFLKQKQITRDLKPIHLGGFVLYPNESLLAQGNEKTKLTDKELSILLHLAAQHPQKTPRKDLLDHVWGYADGVETHTLETHIYRLRQKIESDPANPNFLMTDDEGYFLNL